MYKAADAPITFEEIAMVMINSEIEQFWPETFWQSFWRLGILQCVKTHGAIYDWMSRGIRSSLLGLPFNQSHAANPASFPCARTADLYFFEFWLTLFLLFYWPLWSPRFWFGFFFLTLKRKALHCQISYSSIWALLNCVRNPSDGLLILCRKSET